jgi:hypothetical protein
MAGAIDYANLPTPPACVADFCLIPVSLLEQRRFSESHYTWPLLTRSQIGTPTASVSNEVAAVQRLMKASGLSYSMHSAGTTVGKKPFSLSPLLNKIRILRQTMPCLKPRRTLRRNPQLRVRTTSCSMNSNCIPTEKYIYIFFIFFIFHEKIGKDLYFVF